VAAAAEREVAVATGRPLFPNSKGDGASANRDYGVEVMENGFLKMDARLACWAPLVASWAPGWAGLRRASSPRLLYCSCVRSTPRI
jgi:hypothetical protein